MSDKKYMLKLDQDEIRVLMELQENPFATYDELANRTKFPKTTIFRIVKKLENPPSGVPYFRVFSIMNFDALNLENLSVFIKENKSDNIKKVILLCQEHPYIWYYARCFGKTNGYYIQFHIPKGNINKINYLFLTMKTNLWIEDFHILHFETNSIITRPIVDYWDFKTLSFTFNWLDWINQDFLRVIKKKPENQKTFEVIKEWLTQRDLAILAELSKNTRRMNNTIIGCLKSNGFNLSPQNFSRLLKRVNECLVREVRTDIHNQSLDLTVPVLIWGYGNPHELDELRIRAENIPIPFVSTIKIDKFKLYWYIHLSTIQLSNLIDILQPILIDLQFYFIDFPKSQTYSTNFSAYNEKLKKWQDDDDFIINNVLKLIAES